MSEYQEGIKLFSGFKLEEKDLIDFLNSPAKKVGVKLLLCENCDSPSSKNHQGIWCDHCPGKMVDRSNWIIKNLIKRSEKIIYLNEKYKNWWQRNLVNLVGWNLVSKLVKTESKYRWGWWEWTQNKENFNFVVSTYKKLVKNE